FRSREDLERVAESVPDGPTTQRLQRWARETGATFVAGLPERQGEAIYNSAVTVTPSGIAGIYRKTHLYYEEKLYFEPGDTGFSVLDITDRVGETYRLGVMICFDWYFPESARSLALQGADIIAHPSNLVRSGCPSSMPVRALENHVYTITANRIGAETNGQETLTFIGQSLICSPEGDVLLKAGRDETLVGAVEIDPAHARDRQITAHNHLLADRRPEMYG
ncbi:MAG TPA: nitrilase-related carbon-nitrogen hydrolase, partial [Rhodothermales bacterium]|nr:nitrilase-related carbon-nitrogen hydrolase [Rhodothermales bacterium]